MAKNDFPKTTGPDAYPLGNAKENKDASSYSGFKFPAGGGNDIGVYKQPMSSPNSADIEYKKDPNRMKAQELEKNTPAMRVSASDPGANRVKTDGITIRGCGAATKGIKARGPMA